MLPPLTLLPIGTNVVTASDPMWDLQEDQYPLWIHVEAFRKDSMAFVSVHKAIDETQRYCANMTCDVTYDVNGGGQNNVTRRPAVSVTAANAQFPEYTQTFTYIVNRDSPSMPRALPIFMISDQEGVTILLECRCLLYYSNISLSRGAGVPFPCYQDESKCPNFPDTLTLSEGLLIVILTDVFSGRSLRGCATTKLIKTPADDTQEIMNEVRSLVLTCPGFGMKALATHLKFQIGGNGYREAESSFSSKRPRGVVPESG